MGSVNEQIKFELILSATGAKFTNSVGKALKGVSAFQKEMRAARKAADRLDGGLSAMAGKLSALVGGFSLGLLSKSVWEAAVASEKLNSAFSAIYGSSKLAKEELTFVKDISNELGQEYRVLADSYRMIAAAAKGTAMEGEGTRLFLQAFSETATTLGATSDQVYRAFLQVGQGISRSRFELEDLKTIAEALPGVGFKDFADSLGVTTEEFFKMVSAGEVVADDFLPKLSKALHEKFGDAAKEASQNAQQALNRMKNSWFDFQNAIGEAGFMDMATGKINNFTEAMNNPAVKQRIVDLAESFFTMADAVMQFTVNHAEMLGKMAVGAVGFSVLSRSLFALSGIWQGLNAVMLVTTGVRLVPYLNKFTSASHVAAVASSSLSARLVRLAASAKALAVANPALTALTISILAGAAAWTLFADESLKSSKAHADTADKIAAAREEITGEITQLEKLQKILSETAEGTKEHVEAEAKLVELLPDANLILGKHGQIIAQVGDATAENSEKLREYIDLKKQESRMLFAEQLDEKAKAYSDATVALDKYTQRMNEQYGFDKRAAKEAVHWSQDFNLSMDRRIGRLSSAREEGAKLRSNLAEQEKGYDALLQKLVKTGATTEQVNDMLNGIGIDDATKETLLNDYKTMFSRLTGVAKQSAGENTAATQEGMKESTKITKAELAKMKREYKKYSDSVKKIQSDIVERERTAKSTLREMGRSGMSDLNAWKDQRAEAEEYEAAADKAAKGGDWVTAVAMIDKASSAYSGLSTEVKTTTKDLIRQYEAEAKSMRDSNWSTGSYREYLKTLDKIKALKKDLAKNGNTDKTAMSETKALAVKMDGFAAVNKKAAEYLKQQAADAKAAADDLKKAIDAEEQANVAKAKKRAEEVTTAGKAMEKALVDGINKFGVEVAEEFDKLERYLNSPHKMVIEIEKIEKNKIGGMIGGVQRFNAGGFPRKSSGQLAGWGGGDKIKALLEAGEFIVRKEAVSKYGAGFFQALNSMQLNSLPTIKARIGGLIDSAGVQRFNTGGMATAPVQSARETVNVNFNFPAPHATAIPAQMTRFDFDEFERELRRRDRLSSR